ncbi:MAG: SanA/YdcF family protein [Lachnospiraceae bacterium]
MKEKKKWKWKKIFKAGVLLMLIGIICLVGINGFVKANTVKQIMTLAKLEEDPGDKPDAVIVLGAQVKANGEMSKMLKERVNTGIEIYQAGLADKIIMSGDHGREDYDEVNTMKEYAMEQGVPSEDIFMDHAGFSTYESMYRAKEIFEVESAIVVTQEYHLYRAIYDAEALGIEARGVTCDTAVYAGDTMRKLREVVARIKDFGYTIVKPEPTYLGETIPVSGDGNATNDKQL